MNGSPNVRRHELGYVVDSEVNCRACSDECMTHGSIESLPIACIVFFNLIRVVACLKHLDLSFSLSVGFLLLY